MNLTLEDLFALAEGVVTMKNDGHLTIMRFTTGWKVMAGTPNLDTGNGRAEVANLGAYISLEEALVAFIKSYTHVALTL